MHFFGKQLGAKLATPRSLGNQTFSKIQGWRSCSTIGLSERTIGDFAHLRCGCDLSAVSEKSLASGTMRFGGSLAYRGPQKQRAAKRRIHKILLWQARRDVCEKRRDVSDIFQVCR